jgi:hypothetical protein
MCLHSSAPCYFSGPHLGVISDNTLVKQYPPPLSIDERILGDKAYTDRSLAHVVIAPIKKKRNNSLTSVCEQITLFMHGIEHQLNMHSVTSNDFESSVSHHYVLTCIMLLFNVLSFNF